ncbi:G-type lectin S-receptor-like serine/threonine-protein kinase At4g27290 [Benincasa hispida]|uniref:G-type lectin S-receptor-like serine/threonine-protein kinase At4g27290 n=1 Tax=Benincasa hispida TaxID=102211 RepID=UPI0018FFEACB|nr:G-type lectin S-receptor-like serine/threonine-protein kinase At4g27290 [Benincasa hispida]
MENLSSSCHLFSLLVFNTLFALFSRNSIAAESIKAEQSIDDTQFIVSAAHKFELGFFNEPKSSNNKYLGIWYKGIPNNAVVWVANRDNPIVNSSATLKFKEDGNLVVVDQTGEAFWSSNSARSVRNPVAQLLDSGNLVLRDSDSSSEDYEWQSFDHPSDTLLPGMKLGWDSKTGLNKKLTTGEFILSVDIDGLPQLAIRKGNKTIVKGGPWFGHGGPKGSQDYVANFVYNASFEISFSFTDLTSGPSRLVLNSAGSLVHYAWRNEENDWHTSFTLEAEGCNDYELCGNFGVCSSSVTASCSCLDGFEERTTQNFSDGCVRKDPEICGKGEGFKMIRDVKWPDSTGDLVKMKLGSGLDCQMECLTNCSCLAYGVLKIPNVGPGCVSWFHKLIDISFVRDVGSGEDLYLRVAASELETKKKSKKKLIVGVVVPTISVMVFLALISLFIIRNKRRSRGNNEVAAIETPIQENELEMPISTIEVATNHFSISNKIGEGGFGPVYKGRLSCGQEIAVKKLGESSEQGLQEFKNEILLISQLQHRNLVKLLGFCIHKQETLLIYEYMPNKSLDYFLFDVQRRCLLTWPMRIQIIIGIARGLLYLHRDSRLRIIHRDLKAANILLDGEMKPKISDFGMARMFGETQMETKTKRIVGTYGYMSPEYAIDGCFSFKSDVYSFGVVLLEIISGKKNKGFFHPEHQLNLLGHAWNFWSEGRAIELIDDTLVGHVQEFEALRYINIGLLCVQRRSEERPIMSSVLFMLENDEMQLILPQKPGFYEERFIYDYDSSLGDQLTSISNNVTVTLVDGR